MRYARMLRLVVAIALVPLSGCYGGKLKLSIEFLDAAVDPDLYDLTARIYTVIDDEDPTTELVSCGKLTRREIDESSLSAALLDTSPVGGANPSPLLPRLGKKLVTVTGTSRLSDSGTKVLEGCTDIPEDLDLDLTKTVFVEKTVLMTLRPESPVQLVTGPDTDDPLSPNINDDAAVFEVRYALDADLGVDKRAPKVDVIATGDVTLTAQTPPDVSGENAGLAAIQAPSTQLPGPYAFTVTARLSVSPPIEVSGFQMPERTIYDQLGVSANQIAVIGEDNGTPIVALVSRDLKNLRMARPQLDGSIPVSEIVAAGDDADLSSFGLIGRARMSVDEGPSAVLVQQTLPRAGGAAQFDLITVTETGGPAGTRKHPNIDSRSVARFVPVGSCEDPDLGPLAVSGRSGGLTQIVGKDPGDETLVDVGATNQLAGSHCVENGSRILVMRNQQTAVLSLHDMGQGLGGVSPGTLALPEPIGPADALGFGSMAPSTDIVAARFNQLRVVLDTYDPQQDTLTTTGVELPGPAIQLGAADLFVPGEESIFALVSLATFDFGGQVALLVVQAPNGAFAGARLDLCKPVEFCEITPIDVDGDALHELVITRRRTDADDENSAPVRLEIWNFSP